MGTICNVVLCFGTQKIHKFSADFFSYMKLNVNDGKYDLVSQILIIISLENLS